MSSGPTSSDIIAFCGISFRLAASAVSTSGRAPYLPQALRSAQIFADLRQACHSECCALHAILVIDGLAQASCQQCSGNSLQNACKLCWATISADCRTKQDRDQPMINFLSCSRAIHFWLQRSPTMLAICWAGIALTEFCRILQTEVCQCTNTIRVVARQYASAKTVLHPPSNSMPICSGG